jgi:hypothetical protein
MCTHRAGYSDQHAWSPIVTKTSTWHNSGAVCAINDFNKLLDQAIKESITEMLGGNVLTALYASLEKFHNITSDMLADRIDVMYSILEDLFGDKSARIIGKRVARRFYEKLNLPFEEKNEFSLLNYVEAARKQIAD